jgi:hypothetical protein
MSTATVEQRNASVNTRVTLFGIPETSDQECSEWSGSLDQFLADNTFDEEEQAVIRRHIANYGMHVFGGGAESLTVLRTAEVQP